MDKDVNFSALKEAIEAAEREIEKLQDDSSHKSKKRIEKINKPLEAAYEVFNKSIRDQKVIDKRTDDIWYALMETKNSLSMIIFLFGFILTCAMIFTVSQAYIMIDNYTSIDRHHFHDEDSDLVTVEYIEGKVVSLYDQMSLSDEEGQKNPKQTFVIRNDGSKVGKAFYNVNYEVKLVPLNDSNDKLLDLKYIKYGYRFYDSFTGEYSDYKIGTLEDLIDDKGNIVLNSAYQERDTHHDYEVVFWVSADAKDDQMGSTYTFAFQVSAAIVDA